MTAEAIVAELASGNTLPLRRNAALDGLGEAYFGRIAGLLGEDPPAAIELGRRWKAMLRYSDRQDYVLRARGAALRAAGRWRESAETFLLAGKAATTPVERHSFALGAIDSLARAGKTADAVSLGKRTTRALMKLGEHGLAARARLNLGNALAWQDRHLEAATEYERALRHLTHPFEIAAAKLGWSTALLFGGGATEAERLTSDALNSFSDLGLHHFANQAQLNLAHIALLQGRPDDAWELLRHLESELDSPPDRARMHEFLGDTYVALNLYEDALGEFRKGLASMRGMPLNIANCWFGVARAQDGAGRPEAAREALLHAIRGYKRCGNVSWESAARAQLARLRAHRNEAAKCAVVLGAQGARYWEADAWLIAAQLGLKGAARKASRIVAKTGYLNLRWRVDWLRARESGRITDYRRMAESMLIDRLTTRSLAARTSFLRDKQSALRELLGLLIDQGQADEALQWVSRTRSVALIDEIVSQPQFSSIREAIEAMRSSFVADSDGPAGARRASRRDLPLLRPFDAISQVGTSPSRTGSVTTWIDLGDTFARIEGGNAEKVNGRCIKRALKWLEFEMMAPMTNRQTPPGPCEELLDILRAGLGEVGGSVCPDGALWQVPWTLVAGVEPVVALSPSFGPRAHVLPKNPRVVVWANEDTDLPNVGREVEAVLGHFPAALVCRTAASARQSLIGRIDYLHVATHARTSPENPMFSHFEFADEPLFAVEIARSSVQVALAVLAACDTGRFHLALPDEPDGFVRAFLAKGARYVLAGLWPLDDAAAYVTMASICASLKEGANVVEGMAIARAACRSQFTHPYFWGPLCLFSGYRDD